MILTTCSGAPIIQTFPSIRENKFTFSELMKKKENQKHGTDRK